MSTTTRRPCLPCALDQYDAHDLDLDPEVSIGDLDLDELVAAELIFREQWAREVGFAPDATDLFALPAVSPRAAARAA